ncbi:MAG: phage antirepressor KilAC domain-containing protein [Bilophila wadsworthia]|uniref:phage antirepressor KilAC domain-containing protein n=1 Tax=Bilophila wadsworthia TaxID=35833 RepID=UPI00300E7F96
MTPQKVELAEAIMETEECVSVNQFAKILKQNGLDIGANRLYRDLRKDGYLIRRKGVNWNMPKQRMMDKGYFRVVERSTDTEDDYQFVEWSQPCSPEWGNTTCSHIFSINMAFVGSFHFLRAGRGREVNLHFC